ncbi:MAG: SRPBCC family protein [Acidimicrobiales bacterium]
MNFALVEQWPGWAQEAPIQIHHELTLPAAPQAVFDILANSAGWTSWFKGMRRVRIDGQDRGVGALRTVWVGLNRVQERFNVWDEPRRVAFNIVSSNVPGLHSMVEDYQIEEAPGGTKLAITVGVEGAGPLRLLPGLVRAIVARPTSGVLGISSAFV